MDDLGVKPSIFGHIQYITVINLFQQFLRSTSEIFFIGQSIPAPPDKREVILKMDPCVQSLAAESPGVDRPKGFSWMVQNSGINSPVEGTVGLSHDLYIPGKNIIEKSNSIGAHRPMIMTDFLSQQWRLVSISQKQTSFGSCCWSAKVECLQWENASVGSGKKKQWEAALL